MGASARSGSSTRVGKWHFLEFLSCANIGCGLRGNPMLVESHQTVKGSRLTAGPFLCGSLTSAERRTQWTTAASPSSITLWCSTSFPSCAIKRPLASNSASSCASLPCSRATRQRAICRWPTWTSKPPSARRAASGCRARSSRWCPSSVPGLAWSTACST